MELYDDIKTFDLGYMGHVKSYSKNGIVLKVLCFDGVNRYHSDNGPAEKTYYDTGKIKSKVYRIDGRLHRKDFEPAIIEYNKDGSVKDESYYMDGNKLTSEESKRQIKLRKRRNFLKGIKK